MGGLATTIPPAYFSEVLRVREVGQVSVVEFLTFQVVAVLAGPQIAGLDAVDLEELLVSHSKRLPDSLGYDLSLQTGGDTDKTESGFSTVVTVGAFVKQIFSLDFSLILHLNTNKSKQMYSFVKTSSQRVIQLDTRASTQNTLFNAFYLNFSVKFLLHTHIASAVF